MPHYLEASSSLPKGSTGKGWDHRARSLTPIHSSSAVPGAQPDPGCVHGLYCSHLATLVGAAGAGAPPLCSGRLDCLQSCLLLCPAEHRAACPWLHTAPQAISQWPMESEIGKSKMGFPPPHTHYHCSCPDERWPWPASHPSTYISQRVKRLHCQRWRWVGIRAALSGSTPLWGGMLWRWLQFIYYLFILFNSYTAHLDDAQSGRCTGLKEKYNNTVIKYITEQRQNRQGRKKKKWMEWALGRVVRRARALVLT